MPSVREELTAPEAAVLLAALAELVKALHQLVREMKRQRRSDLRLIDED